MSQLKVASTRVPHFVWVVQYGCRRKVEGKTRNQNKAPQNEVMRNAHKQPGKK